MTEFNRTLVVGDGGLASILACAAAADASLLAEPDAGQRQAIRPILWVPAWAGHTAPARRWAVQRQAEFFEMELVEAPEKAIPSGDVDPSAQEVRHDWSADSRMLVSASWAGIERGCTRLVWPFHSSHAQCPDIDEVSRAVDRALLVSRLVRLDAHHHGIDSFRIDVPMVDFSDRQIADLVIDMDLPVRLCWWWRAEMARPGTPDFRREHERWTPILKGVGWNEGVGAPAPAQSRHGAG
ncbi:MAG: hypothetical protein KF787_11525 [Phycisphaeraceae bacterium]|nr:hypothetical protein [Phycisphaerae bacterium]MBX3393265.1 hypothetical protein [Phycisphaeraceae bacterium]HRJ50046.1 hypothetical protein [Phycisphaerales bacterium]